MQGLGKDYKDIIYEEKGKDCPRVDTPAGYSAIVATVSSGCITPVQFVASSPSRVVSGAFTLQTLPHSADSLAPTLEAVRADIVHLINQLR